MEKTISNCMMRMDRISDYDWYNQRHPLLT